MGVSCFAFRKGAGKMERQQMKEILVEKARQASQNAYAPYSGFHVGAAVLSASGNIYTGCNVENVRYGGTICAERVACVAMVAAGETRLAGLAVVGGGTAGEAAPCGICRQFLLEFAPDLTIPVYLSGADGTVMETTLKELCPMPFQSFQADEK